MRQVAEAMTGNPGPDDWNAPLPREHPRPVVLAHGMFGNRDYPWTKAVPVLKAAGHLVFRLNYGATPPASEVIPLYGLGDTRKAAQDLGAFVDRVLTGTGAVAVDIVGHSLGGMMPRYYLGFLGGAAKVHNLVGIAPSSHGMTPEGPLALAAQIPGARHLIGDVALGAISPACSQLLHDSEFQAELNSRGDTVDGVRYTVIWSAWDDAVTPRESSMLTPARPDHYVKNIRLQDIDPDDDTTHMGMTYNQTVLREVLKALVD
jgi:triacylglycerol esterase/lipase EstA (alpha/beta hydrolase family)